MDNKHMDNKQQQMIDFETSWYALGGGSSVDIDARFGLTDRDFFSELNRLVDIDPPTTLSIGELRRMRSVIRRRLWMAR